MSILEPGQARRMTDDDVRIVAGYLGCEIAAVRAVMAVEAAGTGFDSKRRPKMLFEPHIFYRRISGKQRADAVNAGLAYPKWQPGKYPAESYTRLAKAMAINEAAALESASWGLGQVMGFHWQACKFASVQAMVDAARYSEGAQLFTMAAFIAQAGLQGPMRRREWAAFAKGYNGSGYKRNRYDEKLAAAYAKRPASERVVPPPSTQREIDGLLGNAAPAPIKPKPPADALPHVPAPVTPKPPKLAPAQPAAESGGIWQAVARIIRMIVKGSWK